MSATQFDYILVGGGLQSGLIVLALKHYQPHAEVLVVERGDRLGGNHTWSFHPKDVSAIASAWLESIVEYRWPSYQVRLKRFEKKIDLAYASISSEHFASMVMGSTDNNGSVVVRTNTEVTEIRRNSITTSKGEKVSGRLVLDCRGPGPSSALPYSMCGYQKFWGFEITLQSDWPYDGPIVMDDRVDQADGFRFIYSLPFERRRVLIEDTRFSNESAIDRDECLAQVRKYLSAIGVEDWSIVREEHGILPMPISPELFPGTNRQFQTGENSQALCGGYAGGWFHAATGYSFPLAIAFAETIATSTPESAELEVAKLAQMHGARARFGRFLNRLLFRLVKPSTRYQIFRRFYKVLSNDSIARFYSHRFTWRDAFRIVVGWPPGGLQPIRFISSFLPAVAKTSAMTNPQSATNSLKEMSI
ncbi:MAG: lycopene beta-cyclase CrtY [Planctomycetota bacterium]|nr:lycopene beta-cyclase CrtY [Planctomycetota bacterium]